MTKSICVWYWFIFLPHVSYNNERSGIFIFCFESLKRYNSLPFRHWVKVYPNYAFINKNIDKSNQNVPENDQNWIEIVVMAIIYT